MKRKIDFDDDDLEIIEEIPQKVVKYEPLRKLTITLDDLICLRSDSNINNNVIDEAFRYLLSGTNHQWVSTCVIEYLNTFLEQDPQDLVYIMQKLFEYSSIDWKRRGYVFIPWVEKSHWTLTVVDLSKSEVLFFDSMGSEDTFYHRMVKWKQWFSLELVGAPKDILKWKVTHVTKYVVHQTHGLSCGCFITYYAELLSRNVPWTKIPGHPRCNGFGMMVYRKELFLRLERLIKTTVNMKQ